MRRGHTVGVLETSFRPYLAAQSPILAISSVKISHHPISLVRQKRIMHAVRNLPLLDFVIYEQFYGELLSIDEGRIPLWWLKLPDKAISDILTDICSRFIAPLCLPHFNRWKGWRNLIFRLSAKRNHLFFQRDFVIEKMSNQMYFLFLATGESFMGTPLLNIINIAKWR